MFQLFDSLKEARAEPADQIGIGEGADREKLQPFRQCRTGVRNQNEVRLLFRNPFRRDGDVSAVQRTCEVFPSGKFNHWVNETSLSRRDCGVDPGEEQDFYLPIFGNGFHLMSEVCESLLGKSRFPFSRREIKQPPQAAQ